MHLRSCRQVLAVTWYGCELCFLLFVNVVACFLLFVHCCCHFFYTPSWTAVNRLLRIMHLSTTDPPPPPPVAIPAALTQTMSAHQVPRDTRSGLYVSLSAISYVLALRSCCIENLFYICLLKGLLFYWSPYNYVSQIIWSAVIIWSKKLQIDNSTNSIINLT